MTVRIVSSRSRRPAISSRKSSLVVVVSDHASGCSAAELVTEVVFECFVGRGRGRIVGRRRGGARGWRELEDQAGFAFGVGPVGVVEHRDPGAEGGEDLDLDFVFPPAAAQAEAVAAVEVRGLLVEGLEPAPAWLGLEAAPAGHSLVGGHEQLEVRASVAEAIGRGRGLGLSFDDSSGGLGGLRRRSCGAGGALCQLRAPEARSTLGSVVVGRHAACLSLRSLKYRRRRSMRGAQAAVDQEPVLGLDLPQLVGWRERPAADGRVGVGCGL